MPIRIVESPEPLTGASSRREEPALIWSDGLRLLQQELTRYCDQKVSGRSFLVAGHRGSGKTTMVLGAIQRTNFAIYSAWQDLRLVLGNSNDDGLKAVTLRPLYILLQGPNLLPMETAPVEGDSAPGDSTGNKPGSTTDSADQSAPVSSTTTMETVMAQITLGLYRALAGEFTRAYAEKATDGARMAAQRGGAGLAKRGLRQVELASQFELELDQYPSSARLREYWRLSGSLESGVLFWKSDDPRRDPGQGFRELVALSSACQAYQRICGKLSRKDEDNFGDSAKRDAEFSVEAKGSELMKPLTALLAGGAVGAGVAASNGSTAAAVFAGLLGALVSSAVFKFSSSRSREQSVNRADLFIPDLSVATLDRVLPLLLSRIRRAGLAPIFVVDELDKVDLSERITEMVKRLKKLVAENAFFCFLTDRKYFEEMVGRAIDEPYPIEYTYYTNQLFIVFRHQDFHEYLRTTLLPPDPLRQQGNPFEPTASPSGASSATTSAAEDASDLQVLPFILLHDAQMHPIDLRRQIAAIRSDTGEVTIAPGEVRSRPRYCFALSIQVAIEIILDGEEMRAEIDRRFAFLQLAHDALYYISRLWSSEAAMLDLSEIDGRKAFEEYLRSRMATSTALAPPSDKDKAEGESADQQEEQQEERYLKLLPSTCDFLYANVRTLARYLASPSDLLEAANRAFRFPREVLEALPKEPLLIPLSVKGPCYRWARNAAGRRLSGGPGAGSGVGPQAVAPRPVDEAVWKADADLIGDFERFTGELTGHAVDLTAWASRFGVIGTSPAWSDVRRAIERLRAAQGNPMPYAEQEDDAQVLKSFRGVIETGSAGIALALVCASALGSIYPTPPPIDWTLSNLEPAFGLRVLSPQEVIAKLSNVVMQVGEYNKAALDRRTPPAITDRKSVSVWNDWVLEAMSAVAITVPEEALQEFEKKAWKYWEGRLRFQLSMPEDPTFETILCHVLSRGPGRFLDFNIDKTSTFSWTSALAASLWGTQIAEDPTPRWLAVAALQRMYFSDTTLTKFLQVLGLYDPSLSVSAFRQLGSYSATPRPAGIVLVRDNGSSTWWTPSETHPLLICDEKSASLIVSALPALGPDVLNSLGLTYMVFDHSTLFYTDSMGEATPPASNPASDPAFIAITPDAIEIQRYSYFRPNASGPYTILVDNPSRWAGRDPRYNFVSAKNPQELSHAVADKLAGGAA